MQTLAVASKLVAELGLRIGIADLTLDDRGIAALSVDGAYVLHLAADSENESIVLYALLGLIRDDDRLAVWRRLLEYNPSAADGCSLGLDPASGEVILVGRHRLGHLDRHGFERAIENFMTVAGTWRRELSAGPAPAATPGDPRASAGMHAVRA